MKFSSQAQHVLLASKSYAERHHHEFLTAEHLLLVLLSEQKIESLLESCGSDVQMVKDSLYKYLDLNIPILIAGETIESLGFKNVIVAATEHCLSCEKPVIELEDLLISIYDDDRTYASYYLKASGVSRLALISGITYQTQNEEDGADEPEDVSFEGNDAQSLSETEQNQKDGAEENPFEELMKLAEQKLMNIAEMENALDDEQLKSDGAENGEQEPEQEMPSMAHDPYSQRKPRRTMIARFTVDLTEKARKGELDSLVGRENEIDRTLQVLCRHTKNNPVHVGAPGVGKTTIAYGIAQRIADGNVPDLLKDFAVLSLDVGVLLAGTKFRGEFEERIKRLSDELLRRKNVILYIDEIHTIVGSGSGSSGLLDGASLFSNLFTSKVVRCMGATTYEEYTKYFEKNHALARRFQKIDIEEPTDEESIKILQGIAPRLEEFHKVRYTHDALVAAVKLSRQYMKERFLPDKAIDIIDEAGAFLRLHPQEVQKCAENEEYALIDEPLVGRITAKMAHLPEMTATVSEKDRLKNLEQSLKKAVLGQDHAIETVAAAVKRARAGFRDANKPMGCFLFAGPTGVGKTELAKTLAENLQLTLHRFDMSEYQEKHTVSRLIGSPPGYVGFEEGGLLTDAVRQDPNSLVLLDEIEKADSDIFNVLLQVMDYATLTDNQGRKADFHNVLLIMTSNAGAADVSKPLIGFGERTAGTSAVNEAVEKTFTPEFRNRLDAVIPFDHLSKEIMVSIARKEVEKLSARLADKGVKISVSDECAEYLAEQGYSVEFGARNISRVIDNKISSKLVDEVLFGRLAEGGSVVCGLKNGEITFKYGRKPKR